MLSLVTGATSGIGREYARALALRGHDIVIAGRREDLLSAFAREIEAQCSVSVRVISGDLSDSRTERQLITTLQGSPISFLVNNAGFGFSSDFHRADPNLVERMLSVHNTVPLRLILAALPGMISAGCGTVINVGSLAGRVAVPGSSVYVATKSFLERFSESLALELANDGIVVQALLPGYVRTDFHRDVPDFRKKQRNRGMIRWLASEEVVRQSLRAVDRGHRRWKQNTRALPRYRDVVVIPGVANRTLALLGGLVPHRLIYRAASKRPQLR